MNNALKKNTTYISDNLNNSLHDINLITKAILRMHKCIFAAYTNSMYI